MNKKLMWLFAFLLTMVITSIAVQYFWVGNINPAYLLGVVLGTAIGWIILSNLRRPWVYWAGMIFWILFVPAGLVGLVRLVVCFLSVKFPTWGTVAVYILGVLLMLFFYESTIHFQVKDLAQRPMVDERQERHLGSSGYWAFIFLNLLIIGALLQPWASLDQIGLWIGVLVAGLVFWVANLLILEQKR